MALTARDSERVWRSSPVLNLLAWWGRTGVATTGLGLVPSIDCIAKRLSFKRSAFELSDGVAGAARQPTVHWRALARAEGSESFKENGIVVTAVSRATRASVKVFLSERVLIRLSSRRRAPDEGSGAGR